MRRALTIFSLLAATLVISLPTQAQFFFMEPEQVGTEAPDFNLVKLGSDKETLSSYRDGSKAILFFWATWCPHCRVALKELDANKEQFESKGIKLITVDLGEEAEIVQRYVDQTEMSLVVFLDTDQSVSKEYAIMGVPTFFFVNEEGIITDVSHSMPDDLDQAFSL